MNQEARCEFLKRCIMPISTRVFAIGKTSVIHANDHFNLDHDLIHVDLRYSNDFRATFLEVFETIFKRSVISEFPLRKVAISGEDHPLFLFEPLRGTPQKPRYGRILFWSKFRSSFLCKTVSAVAQISVSYDQRLLCKFRMDQRGWAEVHIFEVSATGMERIKCYQSCEHNNTLSPFVVG
jgi:hypothetical protein